ncbi:MAG: DsrE family protein [Bacteroidota bacterium]
MKKGTTEMKKSKLFVFLLLMAVFNPFTAEGTGTVPPEPGGDENSDTLVVVWTSDDPYVAERVCLMYTHGAKTQEWFDEVILIVWGPSAKLMAENKKLRKKVRQMQEDGVVLEACVNCADSYDVADELREFGFDVKGMGKPLTDYLKSGAKVLTF